MTCDKSLGDCAPCKDCPPVPNPVMPRCNNYIPNGYFTNATVVVQNGCIVAVAEGEPFQYSPATSCGTGTGANGRMAFRESPPEPSPVDQIFSMMTEPNHAPEGTTVEVNSVHAIAPGEMPRVKNVGTATAVKLDFYMPTLPASPPEARAGVNVVAGGWDIENGKIHALPVAFPPLTELIADPTSNVVIEVTKNPATGVGTVRFDLSAPLNAAITEALKAPLLAIEDLLAEVADLKRRLETPSE